MSVPTSNVAVIGGGITGWCLALELAKNAISVQVIDSDPCAQYSSTRNQGWLHSGAFFAAAKSIGDKQAAQNCHAGYDWYEQWDAQYATHAIHTDIPSYYLYEESDYDLYCATIENCRNWGIRVPTPISVRHVEQQEPAVRGSRFTYALQTDDHPIDTKALIASISNQAVGHGVEFQAVHSLSNLQIRWKNDVWEIMSSNRHMHTVAALVLACGVYMPRLMSTLVSNNQTAFQLTKIPVLVVQGSVANSMIAIPGKVGSPQIVPFKSAALQGATVCLHRLDEKIKDPSDDTFSATKERNKFARHLASWLRGIEQIAAQSTPNLKANIYVCQKLHVLPFATRGYFIDSYDSLGGHQNLFAVYPGKFTAAPPAAEAAAARIMQTLPTTAGSSMRSEFNPTIQAQPCFDACPYTVIYRHNPLSTGLHIL